MGACALLLVACTDPAGPRAVQLAFTVGPSNATAGTTIGPVVVVEIEDASGFTVTRATGVVTVTIGTNLAGGTLAGTAIVSAVNGVASFPSLHVDKAGIGYTLKATATGLIGATSMAFSVDAAAASRLAFTVPPSNTMGGATFTPPVEVAAQDAFGNSASGFSGAVTVALGGNPAPGTLSGITVLNAVSGYATFGDLSIVQVNPAYTLMASAAGLTGVTSTPFAVAKPTGSLHITATTTGWPGPGGYAACVDSSSDSLGGTTCAYGGPQPIGVNGVVTVTVDTGAHTVLLMGVAADCAVTSDNPHAVHAARGGTAAVPFAIACVQPTLHVTTATTGVSLDPGGYAFCIDPGYYTDWVSDYYYSCGGSGTAIGVNGSATVPVPPGTHLVFLNGVAGNCAVSGDNPRSVDAGATRDTIEVPFEITCFATGSVRVTTVTTGNDPDPNGYTVCVDGFAYGCYWNSLAQANDLVTIAGVIAGLHGVTLSGIAGNCTVSGATARAVTVPADGTVDVPFTLACVLSERIAYSSGGTITVSQLGDASRGIAPGLAPAWSPDGARLAYECGSQDLCAIDGDGTSFAQLTFDGAGNHHPTWSPDGLKIAFAATHGGTPGLYAMAANGSGVVRLTQGVGFVGSPAWSPDGAKIAFDCRVGAGNDDICLVNADGSALTRLTSDPARDYGPAWKPDGSTLAFATTRYGSDEIALLNVAGGGVTRTGLAGFGPTWSPDGTQLAFAQTQEDCGGGWDYTRRAVTARTRPALVHRASSCSTYDAVLVAHSDGSNVRVIALGTQPAWRPHP